MASFSMSVLSLSSPSASSPRLSNSRVIRRQVPSASLSLLTGSRRDSSTSVCSAISGVDLRSGLLHCSLLPCRFSSLSLNHSLSGLSLGLDLNCNISLRNVKRRGVVVRAGKAALCQTKRSRSRKSLARTHGFRLRMRTTRGRAVIKRRRAKGRWDLCPKSNPSSGKRA